MKKFIPIFALAAVLMASCQSNQTETTKSATDTTAVSANASDMTSCFAYTKNRDTASLKLMTSGDTVTGNLNYQLYEKDRNTGTIRGVVKGDTIIADYTFQSEGTASIRQVVFLKKDGKLIEGYGPQETVGKQVKFKNIGKLEFSNSMEFAPVECK